MENNDLDIKELSENFTRTREQPEINPSPIQALTDGDRAGFRVFTCALQRQVSRDITALCLLNDVFSNSCDPEIRSEFDRLAGIARAFRFKSLIQNMNSRLCTDLRAG